MRRALPWLVAGLGVTLTVAGVAVFWWTNTRPPSGYGWTAYAPLEEVDPVHESTLTLTSGPGSVVRDTGHLVGAALAVAGALVLAAVGGWVLGRRSAR
ncbi:hypothetical protein [Geodermatophilus sp. SYSU D01036]